MAEALNLLKLLFTLLKLVARLKLQNGNILSKTVEGEYNGQNGP